MFVTRKLLGGGGGRFKGSFVGAVLAAETSILTLFKAKFNKIVTMLRTLNSEIGYFFKIEDPITPPPTPAWARVSICRLQREPFSIYGGEETIPYRQDIMTSFGCVSD